MHFNELQNFEREARIIHSRSDDFLLFTLINGAYLNLTLNWLCNVAPFSSAIHRKTLIVSLEAEACRVIESDWSDVKCMHIEVPKDYNAPLSWGRQKYINLLTLRSRLMLLLVQVKFVVFLKLNFPLNTDHSFSQVLSPVKFSWELATVV